MARGRANKLRKAERESRGTVAIGSVPTLPTSVSRSSTTAKALSLHSCGIDQGTQSSNVFKCEHKVTPSHLKEISSILKQMFVSAFDLSAATVFQTLPKGIQDAVARDQLMEFSCVDFEPEMMNDMIDSPSLKEDLKCALREYCGDDFGETVLLASTDTCFDELCNFGAQHGHDLATPGPPCACSFTHCLPCLAYLVEEKKQDRSPPPPEPGYKTNEVVALLKQLVKDGWLDSCAIDEGLRRKADITAGLNKMRKALWEVAGEIDVLSFTGSKTSRQFLADMSGLEIYYTVAMRELVVAGPDAATAAIGVSDVKASTAKLDRTSTLRCHNQKLKTDLRRLLLDSEKSNPRIEAIATGYLKVLARHFRDLGNNSYASAEYVVANGLYTRAIDYDAEDPIYPLNRAACRLKLKSFASAEADCSSVLRKDPSNYKAYFRRGVSRVGQGLYELARSDFEEVLKLESNNSAALKELRNLESKTSKLCVAVGVSTGEIPSDSSAVIKSADSAQGKAAEVPLSCPTIITESMQSHRKKHAPSSCLAVDTDDKSPVPDLLDADNDIPQTREVKASSRPAATADSAKKPGVSVKSRSTVTRSTTPTPTIAGTALPSTVKMPFRSTTINMSITPRLSDPSTSADTIEASDFTAEATRVSRLLEGLQICKQNIDSADASKRKKGFTSASFLIKQFEQQALLSAKSTFTPGAKTTDATPSTLSCTSNVAASTSDSTVPSTTYSTISVEVSMNLECSGQPHDPGAPGSSETCEQRKARLHAEAYEQLLFAWGFVLVTQKLTGLQIFKNNLQSKVSLWEDLMDVIGASSDRVAFGGDEGGRSLELFTDVPSPDISRRGSDSGLERSPVARHKMRLPRK